MPNPKTQILGAAIVSVVRRRSGALFTGPMEQLFDRMTTDWPGRYSESDFEQAIEFLVECGVANRSKHPNATEFIRVMNQFDSIFEKGAKFKNPPLQIPYIHEYRLYGDEWLKKVWNSEFVDLPSGVNGPRFVPSADGIVPIDHNQAELKEALDAIAALRSALTLGNDVGSLSAAGLEVARTEVSQIENDLASSAVRFEGFKKRAKDTLTWIAAQSAGAAVGTLALTALAAIAAFFGFPA